VLSIPVAIIGAGPYGLAAANHLHARRVAVRIFGDPMASWKHNMPRGMLLKSYPWASNIANTESSFGYEAFAAMRGLPYHDTNVAIPLDSFIAYGEAYQRRHVPAVEQKQVVSVEPSEKGFYVRLDDGETFQANRVIVAVGMTPFGYLPDQASRLPREYVSHSSVYGPVDALVGKQVVVIGSGSSATDLAALLHEEGVQVSLVARAPELKFGEIKPRNLFQRALWPDSGIGEGWFFMGLSHTPWLVHRLPADVRFRLAYVQALGPLGGAFMRKRVIDQFPIYLKRAVREIVIRQGKALVDIGRQQLRADHIIFATGYRIDVNRVSFLSREITRNIHRINGAPLLNSHYESSVPGLHWIGPAAAPSFGPICRFVHGTRHPARHLARHLAGTQPRIVARPQVAT
jgi:cation diffusion facilitator CzcD-associated flavoprotein CzcO